MGEIIASYPIRANRLPISPNDVIKRYCVGLPINYGKGQLTDDTIIYYIRQATQEVENFLNIKIYEQDIFEEVNYSICDAKSHLYLSTIYPVVDTKSMSFHYGNNFKLVDLAKEWHVIKQNKTNGVPWRRVNLMPVFPSITSYIYYPMIKYIGMNDRADGTIPDFIKLEYKTGWKCCPDDIKELIGLLAAVNIVFYLSNTTLTPGLTFQLVGIDGLSNSQSVGDYAFKAYLKNLEDRTKRQRDQLKVKYVGYLMQGLP